MANKNIYFNKQGDKYFDQNGHLVLRKALGINGFQQSANFAFLQSENGARCRQEDPDVTVPPPVNLSPKYHCFSYIESATFGPLTYIQAYQMDNFGVVFDPYSYLGYIGIKRDVQVPFGPIVRSRIGLTFELNATYLANTIFKMVFPSYAAYGQGFINIVLLRNTTDQHLLYAPVTTAVAKTSLDWEIEGGFLASPLGSLFAPSDTPHEAIIPYATMSPFFGSNMSFILASLDDFAGTGLGGYFTPTNNGVLETNGKFDPGGAGINLLPYNRYLPYLNIVEAA